MHTPEKIDCYWLAESIYYGSPSLNSIASAFFGRNYKGQQTDDCLPRGIIRLNCRTEADCLEKRNMESIDAWLAKNPEDYEFQIDLEREAPGVACVLSHLILNGELPYGEYLINIDW